MLENSARWRCFNVVKYFWCENHFITWDLYRGVVSISVIHTLSVLLEKILTHSQVSVLSHTRHLIVYNCLWWNDWAVSIKASVLRAFIESQKGFPHMRSILGAFWWKRARAHTGQWALGFDPENESEDTVEGLSFSSEPEFTGNASLRALFMAATSFLQQLWLILYTCWN